MDSGFLALLAGLLLPMAPTAVGGSGPGVDELATDPAGNGAADAANGSSSGQRPATGRLVGGTVDAEPFGEPTPEASEHAGDPNRQVGLKSALSADTLSTAMKAAVPSSDEPIPVDVQVPPACHPPERMAMRSRAPRVRDDADDEQRLQSTPPGSQPVNGVPAIAAHVAAAAHDDPPAGADAGRTTASIDVPANPAPLPAGTSEHVPAAQVEQPARPVTTVLAMPDAQGREVTARLVVTGGGHGQALRIELQPADLGRVEVSLRLHDTGAAAANFTVDRLETLQLLQRDARTVTEMLTAAGFTVDQGSLGFTLRDSGGEPGQQRQPQAESLQHAWQGEADRPRAGEARASTRRGLLDLHV